MHRTVSRVAGVIAFALAASLHAQPCDPTWSHDFPAGEVDGLVRCSLVADVGDGPVLYLGGAFRNTGGFESPGVAAFDGHAFRAVGQGLPAADIIYGLAAGAIGGQQRLFAGGTFKEGQNEWSAVMQWDGAAWTRVGDVFFDVVRAVAIFDDGHGPALYAAGLFQEVGGLAVWDGEYWHPVGGGLSGDGYSLTVWDDGRGPALYVGGEFDYAGVVEVHGTARWDGQAWEPLGAGLTNDLSFYAITMLPWNDGGQERLVVGGWFDTAGGVPAAGIATWDGEQWASLGLGLAPGYTDFVTSLAVFDDGEGEHLYAGGTFDSIPPDIHQGGLARWNGESWDAGGLDVYSVGLPRTLASYKGSLLLGGELSGPTHIVRRSGSGVSQLGNGMLSIYDGPGVYALARVDLGGGPGLYAAGNFTDAGDNDPDVIDFDAGIASWDGSSWHSLDTALGNFYTGMCLLPFDDGAAGPVLFVGGDFQSNQHTPFIERWDGDQWLGLPGGPKENKADPFVGAMIRFDDGRGPALFVAGRFRYVEGLTCNHIARWDGSVWSTVGIGFADKSLPGIRALCEVQGADGPTLVATGQFTRNGYNPAPYVSGWNGEAWSPLGTGFDAPGNALCVFDDGSGPALYAGGEFTTAGDQPAARLARWDGESWSPVGLGTDGPVIALAVFDDGSGPALYIGGDFSLANEQPAANLVRFDGQSWFAAGLETDGPVRALLPAWQDGRSVLWVGGSFLKTGGISSGRIARLDACACYADLDGSGTLDIADFLLFQSFFAIQDSRADCDATATWDLFDFLCFVNAFNAGCP